MPKIATYLVIVFNYLFVIQLSPFCLQCSVWGYFIFWLLLIQW